MQKGSFGVEVLLWLFFLLPGFLYSIWRMTTTFHGCPKCQNASMIPVDTPMGQKLAAQPQQPTAPLFPPPPQPPPGGWTS
jgi:hypothetical protein